MSSSVTTSAIFVTDTPNQIKTKVNQYAFSGGRKTKKEHEEMGGNVDIDIPYQYLTFFLEDDMKLKQIHDKYQSGQMLSGQIKAELVKVLTIITEQHQKARAAVTDDIIDAFMTPRKFYD